MHLLTRDSERGHAFDVVCVVSSDDTFEDRDAVAAQGVPTESQSIRRFYERRGAALYRDFDARASYDAGTVDLLRPHAPDLVLLAGYLFLVTDTLLTAYPRRILNLHFSDLTLRHPGGRPRFPGIGAVRDALAAGHPSTAATVHLVDRGPDTGPPIVQSWPFMAAPLVRDGRRWHARHMLNAYAAAHQEWMARAAAGPLWSAALELVTSGSVDLDDLALRNPAAVAPWKLDERHVVTAPADESPVGMAMLGGRW